MQLHTHYQLHHTYNIQVYIGFLLKLEKITKLKEDV